MMGLFDQSKTQALKEKTKGLAKSVGRQSKTVFIQNYNALPPQGKLGVIFAVFLVILIIAILILWAIGYAVSGLVGFFGTAYGIAVLILLMMSVGIYLYLKMSGVIGEQEWYVSLLMIGVIMFMIIIFIGVLPMLEEAFISIFPFLLIGAVIYGAYLFIKHLPDRETKTIATIILIAIVILIPISQMFIVPAVYGHPMRVDTYIARPVSTDTTKVYARVSSGEWAMYLSATTSLNPFGATVYETSRTLWYMGNYEKYYYTITVKDYYGKVLYQEMMKPIYLTKGDMYHSVGLYYLPNARYYFISIDVTVYANDGATVLETAHGQLSNG